MQHRNKGACIASMVFVLGVLLVDMTVSPISCVRYALLAQYYRLPASQSAGLTQADGSALQLQCVD